MLERTSERSWGRLEPLGALLQPSRGLSERSCSRLEASRSALGAVSRLLGALLEPSRGFSERSWSRLEASRSALGAVSRPLGAVLSDFEAPVAPTSIFFDDFDVSREKKREEIRSLQCKLLYR